jgi:hypothetical protein
MGKILPVWEKLPHGLFDVRKTVIGWMLAASEVDVIVKTSVDGWAKGEFGVGVAFEDSRG